MGRRPQPHIRERILDACTDHALTHGLPDRLAPLAAAAQTSPRMLLYHFTTRDQLLREILQQARNRQLEAFTQLLRVRSDEPYTQTLGNAWAAIAGEEGRPYLDMFNRLHDTEGGRLWPNFRRAATTDWLPALSAGMASIGRPQLATLALAVIRGLLMDLDATGDSVRTNQAFGDFLALIDNPSSISPTGPRTMRTTTSGPGC